MPSLYRAGIAAQLTMSLICVEKKRTAQLPGICPEAAPFVGLKGAFDDRSAVGVIFHSFCFCVCWMHRVLYLGR